MISILMYISTGLIIFGFLLYFVMFLLNNKKIIDSNDGFNVTKDILREYDSINIVENKSIFTVYNIKRKVIKIASKCYYGNSVSDIAIPLMEAGISAIDNNHNKYINFFRKIINNLKLLYILPVLALLINGISYNINDALLGLFLLVIFMGVNYILIDIKSNAYTWLSENLKLIKENDVDKILHFVNRIILCDKIIFIGELVMIIRFVGILLQ